MSRVSSIPLHLRRAVLAGIALVALALAAFALSPFGGPRGDKSFGVLKLSGPVDDRNPLGVQVHKVVGSDVPADLYGSQVGESQRSGSDLTGRLVTELAPIAPEAYEAPVARYIAYAERWTARTRRHARTLHRELAAGDRRGAQAAWRATWSSYLHLGAVYGLFGDLDQAIDGMPGGLPRGAADPDFTGLHRIEKGLWTGERPQALLPTQRKLERSLAALAAELPDTEIDPLDYRTRAHEILEDAQRKLLTSTDVPWSGEGVLGTAALLAATHQVIGTLEPLLQGRNNVLIQVQSDLRALDGAVAAIRRRHHGHLPTLNGLGRAERARLNGTMTTALAALAFVPPSIETAPSPVIPRIK